MSHFARSFRIGLCATALFCLGAPTMMHSAFAAPTHEVSPRANHADGGRENRSRRGRFADGILVGRLRREGMYSSLTLGFSNCLDGRNDADCNRGMGPGNVQGSVGFTKEMGYRVPWFFGGLSYSLGFFKPNRGLDPVDTAYQHSILAVLRPVLPLWRFDIGLTISPGWSRQVFRGANWSDRMYTQGFALGLGAVVAFNITRRWLIGLRWDSISNFHGKVCASSSSSAKTCREIPDNFPSTVNQGLSGLFLSHRW